MKNNHNLPFLLLMAWLISPLLAFSARSGGVPDKGSMSVEFGAKELSGFYPSGDFSPGLAGIVTSNGLAPAALDDDMDFGDAPEGISGYPTTLSNNGARHIIVPGIYLGNGVDFEPDGQPNVTADCDDSDCEFPSFGDDEDGVAMPSSVSQGSAVTIVVSASVTGYLDVWMDFNHVNGWADAGEHLFTTQLLTAGSNTLSFAVPGNAAIGQSYVRFRFRDTDSPISFDGLVQNGEVEDYLVNIVATPNGNIDFGDAPEGTAGYPTTLVNNGARHTIVPGIYLGNGVDPEPNGQPGIDADCDDNDCLQPSSGDDEDGITIPSYVSQGTTVTIGVVASVSGYLDAWIDFNHLNGWADAGEHIYTNTPLGAGSNTLTFTVPTNAVIGKTYVRFRFRDNANPISFTGLASNGEVEDYAVTIEASSIDDIDFGDAPEGTAGFPTTLANNGARHTIVPGIFLGSTIDPEPDGQPSTGANGDDNDLVYPSLGDDEDGVTIPASVSQGSTVTIDVSASVTGYFDAWMDFNHSNGWADAGEHIFTNTPLAVGSNTLSFAVPGNAVTGQSFVRFRFRTTNSPISFNGLVQNGEVEDYPVNIVTTPNGNIDFGDAPEGTAGFPTTLVNNGARHTIVPGIYLGNGIDPEPNGQPGIDADCDDTDCLQPSSGDDEDGITMPSYISPGATITIGVVASVSGYLDAWMDFNNLNGWSDAGEHIFTNAPLVPGSNALTFIVPDDAVIGKTYVRFRFRENANPISFTGLAANGEVEDYSLTIEESPGEGMDFGDAPEGTGSYPTELINNGARHTIVPGIFLGSSIDPEPDGQSSAIANGDDNDLVYPSSGDDEDGVLLPDSLTAGSNVIINITVSVDGMLNAWMDFDKNGSWAEAGEQIFTNAVLVAGLNILTISVPLTASTGNTFARFRFSTLSGLTFTGLAANGEVEDYMIKIIEPAAPVAFNVTGGGSYCAGTGGLSVGLDGSEVGVSYSMYKNGDPQVPAVTGTGVAISFGNQLAGTYTVSGTNMGGTTAMTGSAVIAETSNPVAVITPGGPITICAGGSVTLISSFGGSYLWSTLETTQAITVTSGGSYTVTVTTNGCSDVSDAVTVTVDPVLQVSVSIIASADPVIPGNSVTFTATPLNGGTPTYQWYVNGTPAGSGLNTYTYVPANGDNVYVMMTSSLACVSGNPATSDTLTVQVLNLNKVVYGYNAYAGTGTDPEGPMTFTLSNPGNLNSLANQSAQQFVSGGTWANGNWYGTVYNTVSPYYFIIINPVTGARTIIGNMGAVMNGLSYNPSNGIMYAVGSSGPNSNLYTINLATGARTLIGTVTGALLTNLAINNGGQAYTVDLNADVLGTINLSTGAFTTVGPLGFDAQYAQDMEFDRDADVLYMAAEDAISGWLGYVNISTGYVTKIGDFEGGADVTGFAIPYSNLKTLNLKAYIEGLYDGGGIMHQASDENGPHFGAGIADKVDIELHNAANYSTIEYTSGLVDINTGGNISITTIPAGLSGSYYITIRHRNSIETTTGSPVPFAGSTISYDFSTAASKAYGDNMKLMGSVYAIWGGDVNQDGIVDSGDMNPIENASVALTMGYIAEDVNGDGLIDSSDMNIVENNSIALISVITP